MSSKFPVISYNSGFSAIEVLLVIGILVILAGVGGTNLFRYYQKSTLTHEAQKITALLKATQQRAISGEDNQAWKVHFLNNAGSGSDYYEVFKGDSDTALVRYPLPSSIDFVVPYEASAVDFVFATRTGIPATATSVIIKLVGDASASSTISVNRAGQIQ